MLCEFRSSRKKKKKSRTNLHSSISRSNRARCENLEYYDQIWTYRSRGSPIVSVWVMSFVCGQLPVSRLAIFALFLVTLEYSLIRCSSLFTVCVGDFVDFLDTARKKNNVVIMILLPLLSIIITVISFAPMPNYNLLVFPV